MGNFIALSVPNLAGREQEYVTDALQQGWVSTGGAYITRFERELADYVRVPAAAACQSGTAGLHLALLCCGVGPGDEVIVPTLTFIAAVNPVRYCGAEPVFMDCDDTLCMDMDKLADFLESQCEMQDGQLVNRSTQRPIKAVLPVHVFGNIANMEKLMDLAAMYHFKVIEDATEALGSYCMSGRYAGQFAGTIGDVGVYSFNGNKIITTGGGGMVVSQNIALVDRARFLSTQAKADTLYFVHHEIGYNYRMTNVQAAIGVAQLEQLEQFIRIKEENYQRYLSHSIALLPFRHDIRPNYWFYSYLSHDRDGLIAYLNEHEIQSRPVWKLIHTQKPYLSCQTYQIEKATDYHKQIVNLPCSSNLTPNEVDLVCQHVGGY